MISGDVRWGEAGGRERKRQRTRPNLRERKALRERERERAGMAGETAER